MSIEQKIFERKRFDPKKLLEYGFQRKSDCFIYQSDFMNGDFHAYISVTDKDIISGRVIDTMNDEEYAPLRVENLTGAYVGQVRNEYKNLLNDIADKCCTTVLFAFDQANRITEQIIAKYAVHPDFPWEQSQYQSYGTFRHTDSGKWFALIMNIKWDSLLKNKNQNTIDIINLKVNPKKCTGLTTTNGIYPGYHMNHQNWISVVLNDTLSDEEIMRLIEDSFSLTNQEKHKK